MPQNACVIASKTVTGEVHIFDYTRHPSNPSNNVVSPQLRLQGHTKEGYAGHVATARWCQHALTPYAVSGGWVLLATDSRGTGRSAVPCSARPKTRPFASGTGPRAVCH